MGWNSYGLNLYQRQSDSFVRYNHHPEKDNSLDGDNIQSLFQDSFGDFWIGVGN